jgi:hypothetical protein
VTRVTSYVLAAGVVTEVALIAVGLALVPSTLTTHSQV